MYIAFRLLRTIAEQCRNILCGDCAVRIQRRHIDRLHFQILHQICDHRFVVLIPGDCKEKCFLPVCIPGIHALSKSLDGTLVVCPIDHDIPIQLLHTSRPEKRIQRKLYFLLCDLPA